jgi:hypothetical protein
MGDYFNRLLSMESLRDPESDEAVFSFESEILRRTQVELGNPFKRKRHERSDLSGVTSKSEHSTANSVTSSRDETISSPKLFVESFEDSFISDGEGDSISPVERMNFLSGMPDTPLPSPVASPVLSVDRDRGIRKFSGIVKSLPSLVRTRSPRQDLIARNHLYSPSTPSRNSTDDCNVRTPEVVQQHVITIDLSRSTSSSESLLAPSPEPVQINSTDFEERNGPWVRRFSQKHKVFYWFNTENGISQWTDPTA